MPVKSYIGGEKTVLYTEQEAAELLGVCTRTVRNYIREGRLPFWKHKRRVLIWDRHLMQFIRGARSTRIYAPVEPPRFECEDFTAPPDPVFDADGRNVFEEGRP